MRKFYLAALALVGVSTAAMAGGAGWTTAPYDWTGFYVGAQVGADFLHPKNAPLPTNDFIQPEATGIEGGLNVQALWQTGKIVLGAAADANIASTSAATSCVNVSWTCSDGSNFNASIRGKLGLAANQALFYGTAGWGWADYHGATNNGTNFPASASLNGWVAGLGFAYAINPKWSTNIEYLHYDLGHANVTNMQYDGAYPVNPTMDTVTLGVSYKF